MSGKRRICYVTGTRADFGLMQATLQAIHGHEALELSHRRHRHAPVGCPWQHSGRNNSCWLASFRAWSRLIWTDSTGATMARNIGSMLQGFVDAFASCTRTWCCCWATAAKCWPVRLAAIHLNIPVAHIHGGERSGTVDEPVRHAISKLSHLHFVATTRRVSAWSVWASPRAAVFVTGAPGLDGLLGLATSQGQTYAHELGFDRSAISGYLCSILYCRKQRRRGNTRGPCCKHYLLKTCKSLH